MSARVDSAWRAAVVIAAGLASGCGYRAVHGGDANAERCDVELAESHVPDAVVADEVLAGVRDELARHGALGGRGAGTCMVEVLRADEASEGIASVDVPSSAGGVSDMRVPVSRATRVAVVARAMRMARPGAEPERDTGDMRAFETVAVAPDARDATFRHTDAMRAAARRVGRRLGMRLLGHPAPSED